jgi:hypothetical protein
VAGHLNRNGVFAFDITTVEQLIPWHRTRSGRLGQLTGRLITVPGVQNVVVRAGTARRPDADAVEFGVHDGAASARDGLLGMR